MNNTLISDVLDREVRELKRPQAQFPEDQGQVVRYIGHDKVSTYIAKAKAAQAAIVKLTRYPLPVVGQVFTVDQGPQVIYGQTLVEGKYKTVIAEIWDKEHLPEDLR